MIINTNTNALTSANAYRTASTAYTQASERISTQLRVNSAKDDPVGLGIANKWAAKIASYAKAVDNINSGIAAVNTVDTALSNIQTTLTAMMELAMSSASSTNGAVLASNQTLFAQWQYPLAESTKRHQRRRHDHPHLWLSINFSAGNWGCLGT
jgi:flagellin